MGWAAQPGSSLPLLIIAALEPHLGAFAPERVDPLIEQGRVDRADYEKLRTYITEWGEHPDSLMGQPFSEGIGWKA